MYPYTGSGPYCYANSLAMMLGSAAPSPSVIEVLTGSPFGIELLAGRLPFFDPYGWDPNRGLDDAIALLGWTCHRHGADDDRPALAMLHDAVQVGPVLGRANGNRPAPPPARHDRADRVGPLRLRPGGR